MTSPFVDLFSEEAAAIFRTLRLRDIVTIGTPQGHFVASVTGMSLNADDTWTVDLASASDSRRTFQVRFSAPPIDGATLREE
jgi:hypothetical protein